MILWPLNNSPLLIESFIEYFSSFAESYSKGTSKVQNSIYRNLMSLLLFNQNILERFEYNPEMISLDDKLHNIIEEKSESLIKDELEELGGITKDMPEMQMFIKAFSHAFQTSSIFERVSRIYKAKQILESLLIIQGTKDFGADQFVPLMKIGIVYSNPKKLKMTADFLKSYITDPFSQQYTPLENDELYFITQFIASIQLLQDETQLYEN